MGFTISGPGKPQNCSAIAFSSTAVLLTWDPPRKSIGVQNKRDFSVRGYITCNLSELAGFFLGACNSSQLEISLKFDPNISIQTGFWGWWFLACENYFSCMESWYRVEPQTCLEQRKRNAGSFLKAKCHVIIDWVKLICYPCVD